jgi:hypothetical protein
MYDKCDAEPFPRAGKPMSSRFVFNALETSKKKDSLAL